ncbi:BBOX1 (predicted) [Pycnogonum litorale]
MTSASIDGGNELSNPSSISISWSDGSVDTFCCLQLRDSCRCPKCYDGSTLQRILNLPHVVNFNLTANKAWTDGQNLFVDWDDGHQSKYHRQRLIYMGGKNSEFENDPCETIKQRYWDSGYTIPKYDYHEVMNDDQLFVDCVSILKSQGLVLLKNVACESMEVMQIAARIGAVRSTTYGEMFTVKSKSNPSNLAYTNQELKLHADLPFYKYMPGIQMLHCIKQSQHRGGNKFVDGFHAAMKLKAENPEAFKLLTTFRWPFVDIGKDTGRQFYMKFCRPIIQLDDNGEPSQIGYNDHVRDDIRGITPNRAMELYNAFYAFSSILHDPNVLVEYLLEPGDVAIFDNCRVLHGRQRFVVEPGSGERFLEGIYVDWDDALSNMRVAASGFKSSQQKETSGVNFQLLKTVD